MKAKILVYALPALILATIHLAEAQQPKKVLELDTFQPVRVPNLLSETFQARSA